MLISSRRGSSHSCQTVLTGRLIRILGLTVGLGLGLALSACVPLAPLVLGGAAFGTGFVAIDRRSAGAQVDDAAIDLKLTNKLNQKLPGNAISVVSYNRKVLLVGAVSKLEDKEQAAQLAQKIDNVQGVFNEIRVEGSLSWTTRSADSLLTGKIKAVMIDAKDIYANTFKVVTYGGVVYLMGRVTTQEAERAAQLTSQVGGVKKVVRLFEILSASEVEALRIQSFGSEPAPSLSSPSSPSSEPSSEPVQ